MTVGLARLRHVADAFAAGEPLLQHGGRVAAVGPDFFLVRGLEKEVTIGSRLMFEGADGAEMGSVVRIEEDAVYAASFRDTSRLRIGNAVYRHDSLLARPSEAWCGRVVNALGEPVDDKGPIAADEFDPGRVRRPVPAMRRHRVQTPLRTGVRVIDIFTPICYGQRLGVFAGSGVGKSTLLGMLAQAGAFDRVVVALVGERSREVREFLEDSIGTVAIGKTVAVVATADESALMRRTAPLLAMQVSEVFRDQGRKVLLLLDSVTRFAHALREVGAAVGEPPVARGFPASVFAELPRLLECAGPGVAGGGSITAIVSVLVDGDDHNDPVADAVRGILDGHIVLDRDIADQGRYPPVNVLSSLSRLAPRVWSVEEARLVQGLKGMIARFEDTRDLRMLGSWRGGEDEALDRAVATTPLVYDAMRQSPSEPRSREAFSELLQKMKKGTESDGN